jgi:uncharacterized membrane protein YgdD (TMEM256/DUF423 family)
LDRAAERTPNGEAWLIVAGGMASLLAVAAGAFGRHLLESRLTPHALDIFDTGARYQMYHGLALLLVASLAPRLGGNATKIGRFFLAGIIIFSGSLYALALTGIKILGAVTPLGGICFWIGWILLVRAGRRLAAGRS